ncbi:MAG: hypothetical protein JWN01_1295 [Patescibacteria group bacterium]|nr:hypothetical protein [Patescibacteria group bacterium]
MGVRIILRQLIVFRFEAMISSDYHQALWEGEGQPKDSLNLEELRRWMLKSEDYADQVTKQLQELFGTLGSLSLLFKKDKQVQKLIDKIYNFKTVKTKYPVGIPSEELDGWKKEAINQLQELADQQYGKPIHELLGAIKQNIEI